MSGHKRTTITLSQEEYRKLHEAEMRLRFMNEITPDSTFEKNSQLNEQLQSDIQDMQFRQQALLESLEQVSLDIVDFEHEASQTLVDQQVAINRDIADVVDNYQVETETALATIESQVQSQLRTLLDRHNQDWDWVLNNWQHQTNSHHHKNDLSREWLQAASIIDQFILENYDYDRFAPGEMHRLRNRLIQAQDNLAHNLPEAAITAAQEAYNGLSELRIQLEKEQSEFSLLMHRIKLKSDHIRQLFQQNREVPALDLDGKALNFSITVDYWSGGQFRELQQEFESVMADMVENPTLAPTEALQELVNDYFPCIEDKITDLIFKARLKVINAQLRMNIAEIVVQALNGQGYALDNSFFLTGDERQAYQANLYNYEGSQVVVKIDPLSDQEVTNELHLYTSDAQTKTSHELKQRALEIRRALQTNGLEVGAILASRNMPDPKMFQPLIIDDQVKIQPESLRLQQAKQKEHQRINLDR